MPLRPNLYLTGVLRPVHLHAWVSRLLLLLASVVLAASPVTQNIWTWDHFLHGGHDFETSLLLILAALCLLMVLAHRMQQSPIIRTALCWRSPSRPAPGIEWKTSRHLAHQDDDASSPQRGCNVPLLI